MGGVGSGKPATDRDRVFCYSFPCPRKVSVDRLVCDDCEQHLPPELAARLVTVDVAALRARFTLRPPEELETVATVLEVIAEAKPGAPRWNQFRYALNQLAKIPPPPAPAKQGTLLPTAQSWGPYRPGGDR